MKFKTSELIGIPLDYAVRMALGTAEQRVKMLSGTEIRVLAYVVWADGKRVPLKDAQFLFDYDSGGYYHPSQSHGIGGPILEKECISTWIVAKDDWMAELGLRQPHELKFFMRGPTKLVAGMRCFVASKLGAEVEIPDTLT